MAARLLRFLNSEISLIRLVNLTQEAFVIDLTIPLPASCVASWFPDQSRKLKLLEDDEEEIQEDTSLLLKRLA